MEKIIFTGKTYSLHEYLFVPIYKKLIVKRVLPNIQLVTLFDFGND